MARSLRSQSQASMRRSASSGASVAPTPASRARPVRCAVSTISRASRSRRRRSRPSAWAYSSTSRSSSRASPASSRADERRRQMADGHRGDAALGLRGLARIADDERIDHRQRPDHDLRESRPRVSATALPGSHSSVPCAPIWTMASTLGDVAQPQAEGEQRVARRQRRIVIVGAAVGRRARDRAAARP